jgi:hypothetical protein
MTKTISFIVASLMIPQFAMAEEDAYDGYSYMAVGFNSVTYKEHVTTQKGNVVDSKAETTDVYYLTGGLVRIGEKIDFSYDLASTLYPNDVTEDVYENGVYQSNKADILLNNMTYLLHYKLTPNHRIVCGGTYILNTYKRFDFMNAPSQGVVEERSASIAADIGYWYESAPAGKRGVRITAKALLGLPIWQKTTNTNTTAIDFDDTEGYNADASIWLNYTVYPGLEVGLMTGYSYMLRQGGGPKKGIVNNEEKNIYWPHNSTGIWYGSLCVTWNFK